MTPSTVALCGAGMISHVHAAAARNLGMNVVAVASRSDETRSRRAADLAARSVPYDSLPAGADLVIVATPPSLHFDHVVHSLERGSCVVVEKPMVVTLNEADRLATIASRHANRVLYAENLAYAPAFRRWISQIADIGPLHHLSARMEQGPPTWGDFLTPQWGGGVLFDLGVHPIALLVLSGRASGAGEVMSVTARLEGDTTDEFADVTMRFANGSAARLVVSWRGSTTPHWSFQAASDSATLTLELMPDVLLERNGTPIPISRPRTDPPMLESLGYVDQLRAFRDDISTMSTPWMNVEFGRWIMEIVCASYVSAGRDGDEIAVPSGCDRMLTPWQLWRQH